jgi:hypothetical protein
MRVQAKRYRSCLRLSGEEVALGAETEPGVAVEDDEADQETSAAESSEAETSRRRDCWWQRPTLASRKRQEEERWREGRASDERDNA